MRLMSPEATRAFLMHGTRTAKLATVRADGRPHVVPVGFILDGEEIVFTTGRDSVKGKSLRRYGRVALCVDDERPPYAFVAIEGEATISEDRAALRDFATRIAARYVGADGAVAYGDRAVESGELLVRVTPASVVAQAAIAE